MQYFRIAGYWRRFAQGLVDTLITFITFGIYGIIRIILFCSAKQTLGMKLVNITYSADRQLRLFLWGLLATLLYLSIIFFIYDLIMVCSKKGTFAERRSNNYQIII